jgi:putative transposase
MKGRRHTPEQVVLKLREADRLLAEGAELPDVCRHLEISIQTYQRWRSGRGVAPAGQGSSAQTRTADARAT